MRARRSFLRCASAALALLMPAAASVRAEVIDRVLAVVAGDVIMLSDVSAARDFGLVEIAEVATSAAARDPVRAVLSRLIDRSLMLAEVERYAPPEPPADAVDRELDAVRARFADSAAFDRALARAGIDENHLRGTLRQDLRIRAYLEQRFTVADDQRGPLVDEWLAGLRRRAEILDLYVEP